MTNSRGVRGFSAVPRKRKTAARPHEQADAAGREAEVRIIGGEFRGRRLRYHGDPIVRPMKHRTREAIFNLVTTDCAGRHAIDLFAGTGALGLEALSRGAACATFVEKHVPSARMIEENIRTLGVADRATLFVTSAFLWAKRDLPRGATGPASACRDVKCIGGASGTAAEPYTAPPWLVFCSPPYAFYEERLAEMLDLIRRIQGHAPADSVIVVEADERFSFELLRTGDKTIAASDWDVRAYPPAVVGIWRAGKANLPAGTD